MTPGARPADEETGVSAQRWTPRHAGLLIGGLGVAFIVHWLLFPVRGLAGDLDEFAGWVHRIATGGLGGLYAPGDVAFPPAMAFVWGLVAALEPAFRTATDAADPVVRAAMKLPPTIADLALAAGVAFALRTRPTWAVAAALVIALHPAVVDASALFGQYEAIYTLFGLVAFLLAVSGRTSLAAIALALALMTKPQAAAFVVPFAAWSLAHDGWRGTARLVAIALATIVIVWLPFVPFGGPADYLRSLASYQNELFGVLSLRAWNPWWILQSAAGGNFLSDSDPLLGPLTPRQLGLIATALLELYVFALVYRRPTREGLAWGLVASSLVAFVALTTMHERYAYPALVFLVLLFPDPRAVGLWLVFGVAFAANLLAAVPPNDTIGALLPLDGIVGVTGSIAIVAVTVGTLVALRRASPEPRAAERPLPTPLPV